MSDSLLMLLEMIDEVLEEQKRANKGNVLEGILVAAFGALYKKFGESNITEDDVLTVIQEMSRSGNQLTSSYSHGENKSKQLRLYISLKTDEINELKAISTNQNMKNDYQDQISSCVEYVNQERFRKHAIRIERTKNTLEIKTIGKKQRKGETADLQFVVDGEVVDSLNISVKKDNTLQLTQAMVSVSGTGKEADNFIEGVDNKYSALFNVAPEAYEKFKQAIKTSFAPISGNNCVIGSSRTEMYDGVDLQIQKCQSLKNQKDLTDWLNSLADEAKILLDSVASKLNENPERFIQVAPAFLQANIGAPEIFKSAKRGKKPKIGRPGIEGKNIARNLQQLTKGYDLSFEAAKESPQAPTVLFRLILTEKPDETENGLKTNESQSATARSLDLLKFRFRKDASSSKGAKKLVVRLYLESTDEIYNLMKIGSRTNEQLTIEIVDDI